MFVLAIMGLLDRMRVYIARPSAATKINRKDAKDAKNFFFAPGESVTSRCENIKTFALLASPAPVLLRGWRFKNLADRAIVAEQFYRILEPVEQSLRRLSL
jgi:hypothetical protein